MQKGSSLAEVLISVFLSTLVIASLMQMYLSHKQHYQQFQKELDAQYDLQQISDLMRQSIRSAGFTPCLALDQLTAIDRRHDDKAIHALQTVANSLHTSRMSDTFYPILKVTGSQHLLLPDKAILNVRHPVLLADCYHAEVHRIDSLEHSRQAVLVKLARPLLFNYEKGAYIGEWIEEQWSIRYNGQGTNALYLHSSGAEELSSIVNAMKINQDKALIEIQLQTHTGKNMRFFTAMRNL